MSEVDKWIDRLAADSYPFDTVVWQVMVLAQNHGVGFADTLLRVARARIDSIAAAENIGDPLLWAVVSSDVKLGDEFAWHGQQRAYCIHTDQHGVRRARIAPRYHYNGEPHIDAAETFDERGQGKR